MSPLKPCFALIVLAAVWCGAGSLSQAQDPAVGAGGTTQNRIPTLDYNYYHPDLSGGATGSQIPAQLYLCPRPVPAYVGHVYITYPPFQPHEWLWEHNRGYVRYHPGGGWNMTTIRWVHEDRHFLEH